MKSHKDASEALTDAAKALQDQMTQKGQRANVIVSKPRMQTINEYVIVFAQNLAEIIDAYNLSKVEIRVILEILKCMQFGNLISLSNASLAKSLNMDPSNLSKVFRRLKKTELMLEMNGSLYFNPHISCKGILDERKPEDGLLLDFSATVLDDYNSKATPSIATNNIRKRNREKTVTSHEEIQKKVNTYFNNNELEAIL